MTLDHIAQLGIMLCGVSAIWFVGRTEKWRRWGFILGMLGQPFWIYTTIKHGQYAITAMTLLYAYSWGQGIWLHWIKPWRAANKEPPDA